MIPNLLKLNIIMTINIVTIIVLITTIGKTHSYIGSIAFNFSSPSKLQKSLVLFRSLSKQPLGELKIAFVQIPTAAF